MSKKKEQDKEGMVIGGSILMGLGVGFIFLEDSPLFFIAGILIGLGLGLFASQWLPKE